MRLNATFAPCGYGNPDHYGCGNLVMTQWTMEQGCLWAVVVSGFSTGSSGQCFVVAQESKAILTLGKVGLDYNHVE